MQNFKRAACGWRLNPDIIARLKKAAKEERRSQVDQVEIILEKWLEAHEQK